MGSIGAMRQGSRGDRYFQEECRSRESGARTMRAVRNSSPRVSRDVSPYKGTVAAMVHQLVGGLRAGMGYCGSESLTLRHCSRTRSSCRITPAGVREGHVHDVVITKEAPNYRSE